MKKTLAAFLVSVILCFAQTPLADTLRKGIAEEESNNNLEGAIKAYQAVLSQFDKEREVAATALFRLAETYRKMGKNRDAAAAYGRVVREFPNQKALADRSRTYLPTTSPAPSAGDTAELELQMQRLDVAKVKAERARKDYELGATDQVTALQAEVELKEARVQLRRLEDQLAEKHAGPR